MPQADIEVSVVAYLAKWLVELGIFHIAGSRSDREFCTTASVIALTCHEHVLIRFSKISRVLQMAICSS